MRHLRKFRYCMRMVFLRLLQQSAVFALRVLVLGGRSADCVRTTLSKLQFIPARPVGDKLPEMSAGWDHGDVDAPELLLGDDAPADGSRPPEDNAAHFAAGVR